MPNRLGFPSRSSSSPSRVARLVPLPVEARGYNLVADPSLARDHPPPIDDVPDEADSTGKKPTNGVQDDNSPNKGL